MPDKGEGRARTVVGEQKKKNKQTSERFAHTMAYPSFLSSSSTFPLPRSPPRLLFSLQPKSHSVVCPPIPPSSITSLLLITPSPTSCLLPTLFLDCFHSVLLSHSAKRLIREREPGLKSNTPLDHCTHSVVPSLGLFLDMEPKKTLHVLHYRLLSSLLFLLYPGDSIPRRIDTFALSLFMIQHQQ